ncbi:NAD(P)H-dependent oxidoreductase [Mesorhizobium captivum]|uniref:NAD(P)H-dependent oxidoreductase n=1 Tax=Mesorhizobium captivum TaxID=3072319 RepID=UPI002A240A19|nr:NAD(P)H-dependent oxidoreductase [Mesorhizobium sp. VK3C]MDX8444687.1 NAD(P)H-dependent oxidoreductase [Mesorhizobium sp. VK3C]
MNIETEWQSTVRVFIVHAHPEPKSFNGALTRTAQEALSASGQEVVVSDLYAMGFNPVSDRPQTPSVSRIAAANLSTPSRVCAASQAA